MSAMVLDDSKWSHKAWMSATDADLLESVITRKAQAAQTRLNVLEWGAGRSSLYFSDLLRNMGLDFRWLSLEYDRSYFNEAIAPQLLDRPETTVRLVANDGVETSVSTRPPNDRYLLEFVVFDFGKVQPFLDAHEQDRRVDMESYIEYPRSLRDRFDIIFVDGRKRRRCLVEAASLLKEEGVVLLHDAYREYYQCAFELFRSNRMLGEILWIGSQAKTNFLKWIV